MGHQMLHLLMVKRIKDNSSYGIVHGKEIFLKKNVGAIQKVTAGMDHFILQGNNDKEMYAFGDNSYGQVIN